MTIQCFDDNSTQQMSPATATSCDNLFIQENHPTSASDRINPSVDIRNNRHWNPNLRDYLRNFIRHHQSMCNRKRNTFYSPGLRAELRRLLNKETEQVKETISEEHLKMIRKRHALFLVTIRTMILYHRCQLLENEVSALHKKVLQIKKEKTINNDNEITSK